jgi:hypothetical protein
MLRKKCITPTVARAAFERMREGGRRLPWDVVEKLLKEG